MGAEQSKTLKIIGSREDNKTKNVSKIGAETVPYICASVVLDTPISYYYTYTLCLYVGREKVYLSNDTQTVILSLSLSLSLNH